MNEQASLNWLGVPPHVVLTLTIPDAYERADHKRGLRPERMAFLLEREADKLRAHAKQMRDHSKKVARR